MRKHLFFISLFAVIIIFAGFSAQAQTGIITTISGDGAFGYTGDGGAATAAELYYPYGVAVDGSGNIYIADQSNNCIRKVNTSGVITTIAGNGTPGYSGDGGAATAAELSYPTGVAVDGSGNIYIADYGNSRLRKVNSSGVITTFAGNGTIGYSGDGGAATAAELYYPYGVAVDGSGNLYIADQYNNRIRKVNTSGVITTIAGNGTYGYGGDGGAATAAELGGPTGVAVDGSGNIYIADYGYSRIRKVNTSGVITTLAGNGTAAYSGDGGAATAAELAYPYGVAVDESGNIYIADYGNCRIRKVNSSGVITTLAGNGTPGYTGDGGAATAAELNAPMGVAVDGSGNILYIADCSNNRLRRVTNVPTIIADSFAVYVNNLCGGLQFELLTNIYSAGQHITTWLGNGSNLDTLVALYGLSGIANFYQPYTSSGIYTIKHVLYDGSLAVDSVTYTHTVSLCQDFALGFYHDALGTCVYNDSADYLIPLPVLVEVDSNSVPIDTISATGGLYYTAYGNPGDIYTFRIISSGSLYVSCPATGTISDTLFEGSNPTKYFGFQCTSSSEFDLENISGAQTGRHMQSFYINASNAFCTNETATLTMTFSPQYGFGSAVPAPTSVSGNIATWNLGGLSIANSNKTINVTLNVPGAWLIPGDTVMTQCRITPIIGDTDTLNNVIIRVDTVRSSWDPNYMSVNPSGCIHSDTATMLTYTVLFENTGSDTAHNIYVMDTLSDNLDPKSLRIVSASNTMNISKWYDSIHHNIYKFEFPHINLPDSSHHNQCDGMFIYTIKTKAGLPTGATIFNHAGIFFDDNAVVMTDTTENVMNCPLSVSRSPLPVLSPSLYPNPATNELTIKTPGNNYSSFTITNLMGLQMMQQSIEGNETKVNIAQLPAGVYFVTFIGEGGEVVKKFVKM